MATIDGHLQRVRLAIAKGGNLRVTFPTYQGRSWCLLTIAANKGKTNLVLFFLEMGLPVEGCGADENTPLVHAAAKGFADVVKVLLENGADPLAQTEDGKPSYDGVDCIVVK